MSHCNYDDVALSVGNRVQRSLNEHSPNLY